MPKPLIKVGVCRFNSGWASWGLWSPRCRRQRLSLDLYLCPLQLVSQLLYFCLLGFQPLLHNCEYYSNFWLGGWLFRLCPSDISSAASSTPCSSRGSSPSSFFCSDSLVNCCFESGLGNYGLSGLELDLLSVFHFLRLENYVIS